jgi:hypothetical protein
MTRFRGLIFRHQNALIQTKQTPQYSGE